MTISIRNFQYPADYKTALDLWLNSGEGIGIGPSDEPEEIAKKLQRDPDLFLVAETDGRLIGTVIGGFDGRRGMIYHLAIAQEYRGKGLGSQLMQEIEGRLRNKGCRKAYLLVRKGNRDAESFYEKRGWGDMDRVHIYGKNL